MRILHVIHNLERAGAQVNLANLIESVHPAIERQAVIAFKHGGDIANRLVASGASVHVADRGGITGACRAIAAAIREERPHLLHAHMSEAAILAAPFARWHALPLAVTHHDGTRLVPDMAAWRRRLRLATLRRVAPQAAFHAAITAELRDKLVSDLPIADTAAVHVRNATPEPSAAAMAAAQAGRAARAASGRRRVVSLGRLVEVKGYDGLIAAAAHLDPATDVDIYGEGPLASDLAEQVRAQGDVGRGATIRLCGATPDPAAVLASSDMFVSSSRYEGTSLALLEAMAWRLPIVASDVPGNRELIRDGVTGLLYPHGNAAALAAAVRRLLADPALAARLTEAASVEVTASYGTDAVLGRYAELYAQALAPVR